MSLHQAHVSKTLGPSCGPLSTFLLPRHAGLWWHPEAFSGGEPWRPSKWHSLQSQRRSFASGWGACKGSRQLFSQEGLNYLPRVLTPTDRCPLHAQHTFSFTQTHPLTPLSSLWSCLPPYWLLSIIFFFFYHGSYLKNLTLPKVNKMLANNSKSFKIYIYHLSVNPFGSYFCVWEDIRPSFIFKICIIIYPAPFPTGLPCIPIMN